MVNIDCFFSFFRHKITSSSVKVKKNEIGENDRRITIIICLVYMNMFILLQSISFIVIVIFQKVEYNQLNDFYNEKKYSFVIIIIIVIKMWFISRCISIDSLNSCFQQQKNKTSYDFRLCKGASDIFAKR